jgi:hypothetical protein
MGRNGNFYMRYATQIESRIPSSLRYSWLVGGAMDHEEHLNCPIEHIVILESFANKEVAEEFAKIGVN